MPRYFINIISGSGPIVDDEGTDLRDLEQARVEAIKDARALMSTAMQDGRTIFGRSIAICNEAGDVLMLVPFSAAVRSSDQAAASISRRYSANGAPQDPPATSSSFSSWGGLDCQQPFQDVKLFGYPWSAHAEHKGQKFMGKSEIIAIQAVSTHEQPAWEALMRVVSPIGQRRMTELHLAAMDIAKQHVPH